MKRVTIGIVLTIVTISNISAQQWITSGINIYNSNMGNVGIGTSSPLYTMDIFNSTDGSGTALNISANGMHIRPGIRQMALRPDADNIAFNMCEGYIGNISTNLTRAGTIGTFGTIALNPAPSVLHYMYFGAESNTAYNNNTFRLYPNKTAYFEGNVGIGTITPGVKLDVNGTTYSRKIFVGIPDANTAAHMSSSNLLAVNGAAIFTKATVQLVSNWPDYVFSQTYKLSPLDSLKRFIQLNKHLPEIPSTSEVAKNGIDLGNTQALLLKKIEQLTLYVIDLNEEIERKNKKIQELESLNLRVSMIEKEIEKIKESD